MKTTFKTVSGSEYVLDRDESTLTRIRRNTEGELRKDNEPVKVVAILLQPKVGFGAAFLVEGLAPGVTTLRQTTRITDAVTKY